MATKGSTQAIGSTVGGLAGSYFGPMGSAAGSAIGGYLGGMFGDEEKYENPYTGQYDGLIAEYGEKAKGKNLVSADFYKKYINRAHSATQGRQAAQRGVSRNLAQRNIEMGRNKKDIVEAENTTAINQKEMAMAADAQRNLMQAREGMGATQAKYDLEADLRDSDRTAKLLQGGLNSYSNAKNKQDAERQTNIQRRVDGTYDQYAAAEQAQKSYEMQSSSGGAFTASGGSHLMSGPTFGRGR